MDAEEQCELVCYELERQATYPRGPGQRTKTFPDTIASDCKWWLPPPIPSAVWTGAYPRYCTFRASSATENAIR